MPVMRQEADRSGARSRGHELLTAFVLITPVFWRAFLLIERSQPLRSGDGRGLVADLAVGLVCVILATLLARFVRFGAVVVLVFWSVVHCAVYEHVVALGELPNIAHIGYLTDATFLRGSALHITHPILLLLVTIAGAWIGWRLRVCRDWLRRIIPAALCLVAASSALAFWSISPKTMTWRQQDALIEALRSVVRPSALRLSGEEQLPASIELESELSAADRALIERAFTADLDGEPRISLGHRTSPNVLLILVEGVCGAHIDAICGPAGVDSGISLPFLDDLARSHLCYVNFVTHQGQTNRGTYALLAGDYPRLITAAPKMAEIAGSGKTPHALLPAVLREGGYATAYIQAAPLGFMMKNRFMPVVGFETVLGDRSFERAYERNTWGVDDLAFFEQAFEKLREIASGDRPWFVTLLTAGTHHPYLVPDSYAAETGQSRRERAFYYADEALRSLFGRLEEADLLDNTLVVVTSDESLGMIGRANAITRRMSHHWGFTIVIAPDEAAQIIREPFCQSDVALSVLDYLGLDAAPGSLIGRSLFRSYAQPRPLFFGSTNGRFVGIFTADGDLHIFNERFEPLLAARTSPDALFNLTLLDVEPRHRDLVHAMARRTLNDTVSSGPRVLTLAEGDFLLAGDRLQTYVFGHQYLAVNEDAVLVIELDMRIAAGDGNRVKLNHRFWIGDSYPSKFDSPWLSDGRRYRVRCAYRTGGPRSEIFLRQQAVREKAADASLHFDRATITVVPINDWDGPSLWGEEFRVLSED